MSDWSPPSVPRNWLLLGGVLWLLWLAYAFLVVQQILLGVVPGIAFAGGYLVWRFLAAFEAIADAQQRIANRGERRDEK